MAEILRYEHVDISYNGSRIVKDVSFALEEGEILGIVGESGSGKSTLIKAAMGLLGPAGMVTRGDIWYKDKNLPDLSAGELRKLNGPELGMIFQYAGSSFCPTRTVGAQLYETMTEHESMSKKTFQQQALELLGKLGFENGQRILDSYPFELSGGQMQRLMIARIFLMKPKILLADEPTSMVDACSRATILDMLLNLRDEVGMTVIFITHDIGLAYYISDTVYIMEHGKFVEYGKADEVILAPKAAYTKRLISDVPKIHEEWDLSTVDLLTEAQ